MKSVVMMSTYNGSQYLQEQINSLLSQSVACDIAIRDDGSSDNSKEIIESYKNITLYSEDNIGVVSSFFQLVKMIDANQYDFFAFCDQDDVWNNNKIELAINQLSKQENKDIPAMYFSRLEIVNSQLDHQFYSVIPSKPFTINNALVENIATGCTIILNKPAILLLKNHLPNPENVIMHDWWVYLTISCFGKVIYDTTPTIKYRQHNNNVEGMKSNFAKIIKRIKNRTKPQKYVPISIQLKEFQHQFKETLSHQHNDLLTLFLNRSKKQQKWALVMMVLTRKIFRQTTVENLSLIYSILKGRI